MEVGADAFELVVHDPAVPARLQVHLPEATPNSSGPDDLVGPRFGLKSAGRKPSVIVGSIVGGERVDRGGEPVDPVGQLPDSRVERGVGAHGGGVGHGPVQPWGGAGTGVLVRV